MPRPLKRRLSEVQVADIVARYQAGATGGELAAEFGLARSAVIRLLKLHGVELRMRRFTAEEQARIVELYQSGMRQYEIAQLSGKDPGHIWHVLNRAGLIGRPQS